MFFACYLNKKNMETEKNLEQEINESTQDTNSNEAQNTEKCQDNEDSAKMAELELEISQLKDKYIRQVAEFDNYRKRTLKEKTELVLNGGQKVLTSLLPILDDLDRAIENIDKSDDIEVLREGVNLILNKLSKTLNEQGLQKMDVIGTEFNTDFHEAVALIPAQDESQKNHIIDCIQSGYTLNEKVIRHAKVIVGQ